VTISSSNAGRSTATAPVGGDRDLELLDQLAAARVALNAQIARRIVGQREVVDNLVAALLAGGHALLVGVPGLAKTLLVQTVAQALDLKFSRVQFTPDLMPSDITGTELLEEDHSTGRRFFKFVHGPIFANIVLADEINRAPPKTQAALLQAMQEHAVTAAGKTHVLAEPFFVLATQNPIEQEGTYPLPEAQLDRFMVQLTVGYPSREEEERIVAETTTDAAYSVSPVLNGEQLSALLHLVRRLPAAPSIVSYAVKLARGSARVAVSHPRRQGARGDGRPRDAGSRRRGGDGAAGAGASRRAQLPGGRGRGDGGEDRGGVAQAVVRRVTAPGVRGDRPGRRVAACASACCSPLHHDPAWCRRRDTRHLLRSDDRAGADALSRTAALLHGRSELGRQQQRRLRLQVGCRICFQSGRLFRPDVVIEGYVKEASQRLRRRCEAFQLPGTRSSVPVFVPPLSCRHPASLEVCSLEIRNL
jgi:MoxR-like ATPase